MKRTDVKSRCPINFTMEIFGDPWSLLIIRGIVTYGAKTYGDFLKLQERIGTSVLAERLAHLEEKNIITKRPVESDKRKKRYTLTNDGLAVLPLLYEVAVWGSRVSPDPQAPQAWFKAMELDKDIVLKAWQEAVKAGSSFYTGPDSVVSKLQLVNEEI